MIISWSTWVLHRTLYKFLLNIQGFPSQTQGRGSQQTRSIFFTINKNALHVNNIRFFEKPAQGTQTEEIGDGKCAALQNLVGILLKRSKWSGVIRSQIQGWKIVGQRLHQDVRHDSTQSSAHRLPQQTPLKWSQMVSGKANIVSPHPNRMKIHSLTHTIIRGWRQGGFKCGDRKNCTN